MRIFRVDPRNVGVRVLMIAFLAAAPPAAAQVNMYSAEDEKKMGAEAHPEILKQFGGAYDVPEVSGYVAEVGGRLAANSDNPQVGYTFTLLNSPVVNAFALPGGYVYTTRGLLAYANDEAELAGVLGHEIGHVTAHHTAQRQTRATILDVGSAVLGAVLGSPELGQAAQVGSAVYLQSFSRDQEFQADELGVRVLSRTGYPPLAMADFLETLDAYTQLENRVQGQAGSARQSDFMSDHPNTPDRVRRAIQEAGLSAARPDAPYRRDAFLKAIDGMIFGDDPKNGVVRGRTFSHPGFRIAFAAPPGFRLVNTDAAVLAIGPDDARIRFDIDQDRQRAANDPATYLTRIWAGDLKLHDVQPIDVNGMAGATGWAPVSGDQGRVDLRAVVIRFGGSQLARLLFVTPPQTTEKLKTEFQRTTFSFHRLSGAEIAAIRPLRLRVVEVRAGDTAQSLAERMPVEGFKLERFQTLNALKPGQALRPGQRVKIVTE